MEKTICIIAEGCYPYIVGGVSSWINQLLKGNKDKKFKIVSILPDEDPKKWKQIYEFPENVVEFKTVYLEDKKIHSKRQFKVKEIYTKEEKKLLKSFFLFDDKIDYLKALEILSDRKRASAFEIVTSDFFWQVLEENYKKNFTTGNFRDYYWNYRSIFFTFLKLIQEDLPEADVYHSVSTGYAGVLAMIQKIKNRKALITEHGIYAREREEDILKANWVTGKLKGIWIEFFYYLSKIAYRHADYSFSLFGDSRKLQLEYGANEETTKAISNGIDFDRFSSVEKEKRKEFIVGSILRITPIKDVKMMIKAYKIFSNRVPNSKLYLVGPTDENEKYYEECRELVDGLKISDKVVFTGVQNALEYYKFFDIFVLSSISEGQPLSVLEAMAVGIPIITTDVGNCREMLEKDEEVIGKSGLIAPPTSYSALASHMYTLYLDEEKREKFVKNGREIVSKYYSQKLFLETYRKYYKELGV